MIHGSEACFREMCGRFRAVFGAWLLAPSSQQPRRTHPVLAGQVEDVDAQPPGGDVARRGLVVHHIPWGGRVRGGAECGRWVVD
jgi:hypothetical protein